MADSQKSVLEQARQGDARAIVALLNKKLKPKGITVKASTKSGCLHIMLEAANAPPQQPSVEFLRKAFTSFTVDDLQVVKAYGRREGEEFPDWVETFNIINAQTAQSLELLAEQGDVKAIAALINQQLQPNAVTAKISLKEGCLQLMLESKEVPDQQQMTSLLTAEVLKLKIQAVTKLKIYGKQSAEDFPDWHEEVELALLKDAQKIEANIISDSGNEKISSFPLTEEIDSVGLSNALYTELQTTCYQHLVYRITSEDEKTIHELVEHFVNNLEADLKLDLDQFPQQAVSITCSFDVQLSLNAVQSSISNVVASHFAGLRLAIRELEKTTQEVRQTDFPQGSNELEAFFKGVTQEIGANILGGTTMSNEAKVGATLGSGLGSLFAPVIGTAVGGAIGGAIGGWIGGNKQQKALEALLGRYERARSKLFQEWESLLQLVYTNLSKLILDTTSIHLLSYQAIEEAIDLYNKGTDCLKEGDNLQEVINFYDKAINLNPGFASVWNNKGYALNQLGASEEALAALDQAIRLDPTHVIAFNNRAEALQNLGKLEEAIASYEEAIKLDCDNYDAWLCKGSCLYEVQRYEEAIAVCDKLITLDPENYLGWYLKSCCQVLMDETGEALESLREAVKLDPDESQKLACTDTDFDCLREDERFKALMESSVGVDYSILKKQLKEKQWLKADQETAYLIQSVLGKITQSIEVKQDSLHLFPCRDLNTIDNLWCESSDGKFGFSVQKKIYQLSSQDRDTYGVKTGWRVCDSNGSYSWRSNDAFDYNFETAPKGHLPSCLWAGGDSWLENRRDRLITLFERMNRCTDISSS